MKRRKATGRRAALAMTILALIIKSEIFSLLLLTIGAVWLLSKVLPAAMKLD